MSCIKKLAAALLAAASCYSWALEPLPESEFVKLEPFLLAPADTELDMLIDNISRNITNWTPQDKLCLAKNIYHEAANEPLEGQVAVAVVTLNRALNERFPDNICDVVYQRTKGSALKKITTTAPRRTILQQVTWTVCQFTWTCLPVKPPREHDPRWQNILEIVEHFSHGGYPQWRQKYQSSLNYHAYYVNPRWNLKLLTRTGAHLFYRPH